MPELSALEVFLAVARTAGLGAAGRELGLTQQAVSGVRLAVRTVRGTQLTTAGVVVAQWANKLPDVAQQVDAGLGSLRTESRSKLKVAASLTVAEQLMPLWLVSLQATADRSGRKAPEVILTTTNSGHAISAVRDGAADLGFIESPGALSALRNALGDDFAQASPALELSSAAAVRAAVLAGAGPAVMSRRAVADDLAMGRLRAVQVPDLNLRRALRAI